MSIIKSICAGIAVVLTLVWVLWMMAWCSDPLAFPAWVNWLSGGSFAVYVVGLFAWIYHDACTQSSAAAKGDA